MRAFFFFCGLATTLLLASPFARQSHAQPLVTDGLSIYYSFDEIITNEDDDLLFEDGSPNDLHGLITMGEGDNKEDGIDDIRVDTEDKKGGAGSVRFDTDPTRDGTVVNPDYIAICDPVNQDFHNPDCAEPAPPSDRQAYVPETGLTVAMWAKVEDAGTDHALYQSWASGRGFIHTYIENGGGARFTLRGAANSDSIMQYREGPNGEPIPYDEWVHFAGTYEKPDPFGDDPGEWAFYYNGEEVAFGVADLAAAGTAEEFLGDWGQGAFLGLVPDMKGQLTGWMDEFYLFNRGLSAEEITVLFNGADAGAVGDCNGDGVVDAADLACANASGVLDDVLAATGLIKGDLDGSGDVAFADFLILSANFSQDVDSYTDGDIDGDGSVAFADFLVLSENFGQSSAITTAVPEPSTALLASIVSVAMLGLRRRRRISS